MTQKNQISKFERELNTFYQRRTPSKNSLSEKNQFSNFLAVCIKNFKSQHYPQKPEWKTFKFGSSVWGIHDKDSDIDIAINLNCSYNPTRDAIQNILFSLSKAIRNSNRKPKVTKILNAKCPIIVVEDIKKGIKADISISNKYTAATKDLILSYIEKYEKSGFPTRKLIKFIKYWSKERGINNAQIGYPNSFGWTIMVIAFIAANPSNLKKK
eukprot:191925_1